MARDAAQKADGGNRAALMQGAAFALCFLAFQLTEFTVNDRAGLLLGARAVNAVYSAGLLCTAAGFLAYAALCRRRAGAPARAAVPAAAALAAAAGALLLSSAQPAVFLAASGAALFLLGFACGGVYRSCAFAFAGNPCAGRILGAGMSAAVLGQFAVQELLPAGSAPFVCVGASAAAALLCAAQRPACEAAVCRKSFSESAFPQRRGCRMLAAVAVMSLVIGLIDGVVVEKHAEGTMDVAALPRLFYAASLLAAGFVADLRGRRYLPLAAVCTLFLSTISTALLADSAYFWTAAFMYLYSGFYVMYLTVLFLDLAPCSAASALWAGLGRVTRCAVAALTAVPTWQLYARFGSSVLVAGSCLLSVLLLLLLLPDLAAAFAERQPAPPPSASDAEALARYAARFRLTPREAEVLAELLTTEDGVQEIADRLFLSRRVLQRYIASLYEKTGAKTRVGLYRSFSDFCAAP